jgi:hypothetical protein
VEPVQSKRLRGSGFGFDLNQRAPERREYSTRDGGATTMVAGTDWLGATANGRNPGAGVGYEEWIPGAPVALQPVWRKQIMKRSKIAAAVLLGAIVSSPAMAAGLNYNYLDLDYEATNFTGIQGTGFGLEGSYDVVPNVNLLATYLSSGLNNGVDITRYTVGVGYHKDLGGWDGLVELRYVDLSNNFGYDATGYIADIGARWAISPQWQVKGLVGTQSVNPGGGSVTGTVIEVSGMYNFSSQWGVYLGYKDDNTPTVDYQTTTAGVRYNF